MLQTIFLIFDKFSVIWHFQSAQKPIGPLISIYIFQSDQKPIWPLIRT
jgi:hypothetical protein